MTNDSFRWQAFFQRAREPLFVLNRRRRLVFVNRAWEELTGLPAREVRGLRCRRPKPAEAGEAWEEVLAHALTPPPEVLEGRFGRARRFIPSAGYRQWWDVEFLPLQGAQDSQGPLLGILGRILPLTERDSAPPSPLPEQLVALQQKRASRYQLDQLPVRYPALRRAADQVRLAAQTRAPVLFLGEPGSGKRWLARTLHQHSAARDWAFAVLDCAHLPPAALNAALFGDGRLLSQPGIGTVYLDEPACLPRDLQARLAAWLAESGWAEAERPTTGPRLLAGSCRDPAGDVRAERLLTDLHVALGTLVIQLPPLRERLDDLAGLVERLLERAQGEKPRVTGVTAETLELLRAYRWPGNLRELYTVLAGACARAGGEPTRPHHLLEAADLPAYLRLAVRLDRTPGPQSPAALPLDDLLLKTERRLIQLALHRTGHNKTRAAELLGIIRQRLLRRMSALGIVDTEGGLRIEEAED